MNKSSKRRPKGEGTLRQRSDGRYEARGVFRVADGSAKPLYFYGRTKQEAWASSMLC